MKLDRDFIIKNCSDRDEIEIFLLDFAKEVHKLECNAIDIPQNENVMYGYIDRFDAYSEEISVYFGGCAEEYRCSVDIPFSYFDSDDWKIDLMKAAEDRLAAKMKAKEIKEFETEAKERALYENLKAKFEEKSE